MADRDLPSATTRVRPIEAAQGHESGRRDVEPAEVEAVLYEPARRRRRGRRRWETSAGRGRRGGDRPQKRASATREELRHCRAASTASRSKSRRFSTAPTLRDEQGAEGRAAAAPRTGGDAMTETVPTGVDGRALRSRGAQTRQRLLEAAEDVFAELGYHDASIVKITEAAGVAQGTFYLYFTSKKESFDELVRDRTPCRHARRRRPRGERRGSSRSCSASELLPVHGRAPVLSTGSSGRPSVLNRDAPLPLRAPHRGIRRGPACGNRARRDRGDPRSRRRLAMMVGAS